MKSGILFCSFVAFASLLGCSSGDGQSQFPNGASDDSGAAPQNPTLSGNDAGPTDDGGLSLFYANDDTTLYQLDPSNPNMPMTKIGPFDCIPSQASVMTDIAVSKDGRLFGVSPAAAFPLTIQGGTVHCEAKWPLPYATHFNGLTFAPENTVAPEEALIGGNATGQLYWIDQQSGTPTQVGTLGTDPQTGASFGVSGDIVFMANHGNPVGFATVRTCTDPNVSSTCDKVDTLIEIDVSAVHPGTQSVLKAIRGKVTRGGWCQSSSTESSFGAIFGIVALGSEVYGFSRWGDFVDIQNGDGSGCFQWNASGVNFAGAGITTVAEIVPPPPK
jgi:hypothetical protein